MTVQLGPLYAYSLLPVIAVALLLFFTAALRGRNTRGLALYCLSVALWCIGLLLLFVPRTAELGARMTAIGAFTAPGFLHAAYDVTEQKQYGLVYFAYVAAALISIVGFAYPGLIQPRDALGYSQVAFAGSGRGFGAAMALAICAGTVPLWKLWRAYQVAPKERLPLLRSLFVAGVLAYAGALGNALLLANRIGVPIGIFLVLAGLLLLALVIRAHEPPSERRLLERSLRYSALAAILSAGFLFGVLSLMPDATAYLGQYKAGALLLFCMAAIAIEPVRHEIEAFLGRRFFRDHAGTRELAAALHVQEERADHKSRLAEVGQFASAVAHEVRNPLGVLSANLKLLERAGADPQIAQAMREQISRASHFVDELLTYGRPRPLELRQLDADAVADLAVSTALQGLRAEESLPAALDAVRVDRKLASPPVSMEADQAQIAQLLVILVENALLAVAGQPAGTVRVAVARAGDRVCFRVDDDGPGVPSELLARLFQPFVTGRKREGPRRGTGLGLAIARGIAERHGGSIRAGKSELGGASFEVLLPLAQTVLVAAGPA